MFRAILHLFLRATRLAIFTGCIGLSILVGFITNASLSRRIAKDEARIREMGFPVEVSDLNVPPLSDAENTALRVANAAKLVDTFTKNNTLASDRNDRVYYPFDPKWIKDATAAETALSNAFEMTHQAAQLPPGRVNIKYTSPLFTVMLRNLNDSKDLANAIQDSAFLHNLQNDPATALDRLLDLIAVESNTLDDWTLVSHLVRIGEWGILADSSNTIGATLKAQDLPKTREKILRLIAVLQDENSRSKGVHKAYAGERLMLADASRYVYKKASYLQLPSKGDELFATRYFDFIEQALNSPDWNKMRDRELGLPGPDDPRILTRIMIPAYSSSIERHFRNIAETRSASLVLAAHLYRMEHNGIWPASASDLVPTYLPAVPVDPYYPNPIPMQILVLKSARPDGADRPVVLFNSPEQDLGPDPKTPAFFWDRRRNQNPIRQYRDLTLFDRVISPDEQSLITEPHITDEAGDEQQPEEESPEINPDELQGGQEE